LIKKHWHHVTGDRSIVDVAIFFPTISQHLRLDYPVPTKLLEISEALPDLFDYDVVDERLIVDGALSNYRALIWVEGSVVGDDVLDEIANWVAEGGILITNQ
jgi:hypothetical protein